MYSLQGDDWLVGLCCLMTPGLSKDIRDEIMEIFVKRPGGVNGQLKLNKIRPLNLCTSRPTAVTCSWCIGDDKVSWILVL